MSRRNDISAPEGYFEGLQQRLAEIPARPERVSPVHRLAPYVAIAASFLLVVTVGNFILRRTAVPAEDDSWTYLSYLADALDPDGATLVDGAAWGGTEDLSEDDIINYLLADGISVEQLNDVNYEQNH